jgi:mono/diheme cytochrome c family protein
VAVVIVVGWGLYLLTNVRRSKPEVGSEIELAANRKQYLDDDELEGRRLDQVLRWGLVSISIIGVGLPLYWLAEPGRQSGAVDNFQEMFVSRGGELFAATEAGGFNCAGCHGGDQGLGAEVPYTLTEYVYDENGELVRDEDGEPETELRQVSWRAPALNTVALRMTDEQLRDILTYGRPYSPMPAWGIEGGGPMNEQQIDNLIDYLKSIALSPEEAQEQAQEEAEAEVERIAGLEAQLREEQAKEEPDEDVVARLEEEIANDQPASLGAALFNLNCARCHTAGWSYEEPEAPGAGAMGPSLYNVLTQFPDELDHYEWVANGAEFGEEYGQQGQNEGRMPYFGRQLSREQIQAIVNYERELAAEGPPAPSERDDVNDALRAPSPQAGSEESPAQGAG